MNKNFFIALAMEIFFEVEEGKKKHFIISNLIVVKYITRKHSISYGEYRETSIANNDVQFGFAVEILLRI